MSEEHMTRSLEHRSARCRSIAGALLVTLAWMSMTVPSRVEAAGGPTVPLDIREAFAASGCVEIHDYYASMHVREKPYVYAAMTRARGEAGRGIDHSFIAWCREPGQRGRYRLVADLKGAVWPGGCRFPIPDHDLAGGLSIVRRTIDARGFHDTDGRALGTKRVARVVIASETDGLVLELVCDRGRWYAHGID